MNTLFLLLAVMTTVWTDDTFIAFDCTDPQKTEFFDHKLCHIQSDRLMKKDFAIIQQREVDRISGYFCEGTLTTRTGYCGRYSHDKFTGQDSFEVSMMIPEETCRRMVEEQVFDTGSQSLQVKIGAVTYIHTFTHGGVIFDGYNLACTGGELRLDDESINTNMIQQRHYKIKVIPTNLVISKNEVIDPYTQTVLGPFSTGYANSYSTTYIWIPERPQCDKLKIMDTALESTTPDTWYSDHHQIQLRTTDTFFDQACKIKLINTDTPGLYLSPTPVELETVSEKDVDLSTDLRIRFDYTNGKVRESLTHSYKSRHPMCRKIYDNPMEAISRIGDATFIRNLGEVSVQFTCNKLEVAPVVDDICHSMTKVQDHKGKTWFLEPVTRILFQTAVIIPCQSARVPVYRTTNSELVTYSPERRVITTTEITSFNHTSPRPGAPGLYSLQMVKNWLQFAWLQHLTKHTYSFISQAICQDNSCQGVHNDPNQLYGMLGSAVHKATNLMSASFWLGIDMEAIGRKCSIAVCIMTSIYAVYWIVSWGLRCALFKTDSISCFALTIRSTFPELFLIAKNTGKDENNTSV